MSLPHDPVVVVIVAATTGWLLGCLLTPRLASAGYRRGPERELPRRSLRWVAPTCALACGVLAAAPALRAEPIALPAYVAATVPAVALAAVDLDVQRLPNAITMPAHVVLPAVLLLDAAARGDPGPLARALGGGLLLQGCYLLVFALARSRGGLGLGDVKLAGPLGMLLAWPGWSTLALGGWAGFVLSGVVALVALARGAPRGARLAHGPPMLAGALLALAATAVP